MIYRIFFNGGKDMQHKMAHSLLAHGLFLEYGLNYKKEPVGTHSHGKPFLINHPDIFFNLSHCDGCATCIIGSAPVGIDIENIRPFKQTVAQRVCCEEELASIQGSKEPAREFFRLWTLKESIVKAKGTGLSEPLNSFHFQILPEGNVKSNITSHEFFLLEEKGYITAVCKALT